MRRADFHDCPRPRRTSLVTILLLLIAPGFAGSALAGASGSGLISPAGPGRLDTTNVRTESETYVLGNSIFQGKGGNVRGLEICLSVYEEEDEGPRAIRISTSVLKPFRGKPITALTSRLVDCSAVGSQVARVLDRTEFRALVYFLNTRFRLRLKVIHTQK